MLLTTLRRIARGHSNELLQELFLARRTPSRSPNRMSSAQQSVRNKLKAPPPSQLRREKQQQQQAAKKKSVPYAPGTVTLQVLGAGSNGAPAAVYLFTDQSRYLFNCGEGTQRLAHEHKTKLSRLEQIFVTRNTWPAVGGFPGLALTVQDAGVRELALHGPPYLDNILHSMKRFVVLKNLQLKTIDCSQERDFEDAVMSVKCIPLYRTTKGLEGAPDSDCSESAVEEMVIAYICKLKPRPGALNLEKCVEHGVPPGPLLGLLKNGIDVTLDNGVLVRSKDVSEPSEAAFSFIFLDIPSIDFLPALLDNASRFQEMPPNEGTPADIALVVHFSSADVLANNCYQSFVNNFPSATQHIYLNSGQNTFSGYMAAHRIQYQLNQLNPHVFPLLAEATVRCTNGSSISSKLKKTKLSDTDLDLCENEPISKEPELTVDCSHLTDVNTMTSYHLRPRKGLDRTLEAKLAPNEYIQETQVLEDFPALLEKLRNDYKGLLILSEYPKITFLGTGSCIPNKTRNVSAILVQAQRDSYMLLDCGEGTLGQIIRFFGKHEAEKVIRNLQAIYVSHLHADHHIGLIGLLNERQRLWQKEDMNRIMEQQKVLLFAPKQIEPWLNFYNERIACIKDAYELIGNAEMLQQPLQLSESHAEMGIKSIATCLVRHCPHSFGVSLTLNAERNSRPIKITYSGDTMPCQDLITLGEDSTILIHEATMEDDLIDEAKIKMHSTISQAIQQGRAMRAQHIILTHFSQRYAKLPRMQTSSMGTEDADLMENVAIAFDNMQVSVADLKHFHLMYPALRALFAEHAEELELKAQKRELKLERKRKLMST